jgi:hypothetical protein
MFALGGAVLAGLFLAPRPKSPSTPADVPIGVPDGPLDFVAYDLGLGGPSLSPEVIAGEIGRQGVVPDYVILFHVPLEDAAAIAARFGMQESYDPRLGQPLRAGAESIAACILSRHPLYDAELLTPPSRKEPYGIRAWSVVGGRKFLVACAWTPTLGRTLAESWKVLGSPPTVAGILVIGSEGSTPLELTRAGFAQGWGLPRERSDILPGNWRPRLTFAGPWQAAAGASWDTNNARVGVWASLGGGAVASRPATMPVTQPAPARPGRL